MWQSEELTRVPIPLAGSSSLQIVSRQGKLQPHVKQWAAGLAVAVTTTTTTTATTTAATTSPWPTSDVHEHLSWSRLCGRCRRPLARRPGLIADAHAPRKHSYQWLLRVMVSCTLLGLYSQHSAGGTLSCLPLFWPKRSSGSYEVSSPCQPFPGRLCPSLMQWASTFWPLFWQVRSLSLIPLLLPQREFSSLGE